MQRRGFLESLGASTAVIVAGLRETGQAAQTGPDAWRTFEVTTRLEITDPCGVTRAWVPCR
jgi:hypothetical protein